MGVRTDLHQGVQVGSAKLNLEKLLFFGFFGFDCSNS